MNAGGAATGADAFVSAISDAGVDLAFGLPGAHNLAIWTAIADSPIRLVGVRHEQTAAYAADGYARSTGRLGVALTTTGPGAVNAAAATGEALASHSPILVAATDIPSTVRRPGTYRGALHETRDQEAVFAPLVKKTYRVVDAEAIGPTVRAAAATALEPPTGPVYVQLPTDFLSQPIAGWGDRAAPPGRAPGDADSADVEAAAKLATAAERVLIWVGGGAARSEGARPAVEALAARLGAPVLETYMGRGVVDPGHPCWVGLPPQLPEAGQLWDEADLVIAIGSDLDGMNTQNWRMPPPPKLIALNVDPDDASKNYRADVSLAGDAAASAGRLVSSLPDVDRSTAELRARLQGSRAAARARLAAEEPQAFELLDSLAAGWLGTGPIACDMCIPGYWVAGFLGFPAPRSLLYPVGWGTLGFALPAAIGAALGHGSALCVCGDGGFLFACAELAVLRQEEVPVTILLVDDGGYGMLRYDYERMGQPALGVDLMTPDWRKLCDAFGIACERVEGFGAPLRRALLRHRHRGTPSMVVVEASMAPPPTTSPRWYRSARPRCA